jgi:hypothetical protein
MNARQSPSVPHARCSTEPHQPHPATAHLLKLRSRNPPIQNRAQNAPPERRHPQHGLRDRSASPDLSTHRAPSLGCHLSSTKRRQSAAARPGVDGRLLNRACGTPSASGALPSLLARRAPADARGRGSDGRVAGCVSRRETGWRGWQTRADTAHSCWPWCSWSWLVTPAVAQVAWLIAIRRGRTGSSSRRVSFSTLESCSSSRV